MIGLGLRICPSRTGIPDVEVNIKSCPQIKPVFDEGSLQPHHNIEGRPEAGPCTRWKGCTSLAKINDRQP